MDTQIRTMNVGSAASAAPTSTIIGLLPTLFPSGPDSSPEAIRLMLINSLRPSLSFNTHRWWARG
jgi:hypothetical protein